jgi:hypothetical protein
VALEASSEIFELAGRSAVRLVADQVVRDKDKDAEETGTIMVLLDPRSPHPGKRNSLVDARN